MTRFSCGILFCGATAICATTGCGGGNTTSGDPTAPDAGAGAMLQPSEKCQRYLSCLLAVAPQSYAAQLMLYGGSSECWKTPQQTMNCGTACDSAFADIESQCICQGTTCASAAMPTGCADDSAYEPNDTYQTAFHVPATTATYTGLALCPATDKDFYSISIASTTNLEVIVTPEGATSLKLTVLNPSGAVIANGAQFGSEVRAYLANLPAASYYVGISSNEKRNYKLSLALSLY